MFLKSAHGRALRGFSRNRHGRPSPKAGAAPTTSRNRQPRTRSGWRRNATSCAPSIVADPSARFARKNTKDNPAGRGPHGTGRGRHRVDVKSRAANAAAAEQNKSKFVMLNHPIACGRLVMRRCRRWAAGWCPPGMLGIGIGGTRKGPADGQDGAAGRHRHVRTEAARPRNNAEVAAHRTVRQVNALGSRAPKAYGGLPTVLDVRS
ncbi:fumarate hydratase [Streptomyces andamanensis]|uniref:Fumarate hydratase n=1 Tax=Streptomyces andamanensis TaxID=1565035 RepID=A0ABV8T8L0_9ACTN